MGRDVEAQRSVRSSPSRGWRSFVFRPSIPPRLMFSFVCLSITHAAVPLVLCSGRLERLEKVVSPRRGMSLGLLPRSTPLAARPAPALPCPPPSHSLAAPDGAQASRTPSGVCFTDPTLPQLVTPPFPPTPTSHPASETRCSPSLHSSASSSASGRDWRSSLQVRRRAPEVARSRFAPTKAEHPLADGDCNPQTLDRR